MRLHVDFETYSACPIGWGTYRYASDISTEALMLGWAIEDGPVQLWDIFIGEPMPALLQQTINNPACRLWAYNAQFERLIFKHCLGLDIPIQRFRCTQVLAYTLGFAGRMAQVLERFHVEQNKDPAGQRLINKFSKPRPRNHKVRRWTAWDDIAEWAAFCEYCKQDVVAERELYRRGRFAHVNWTDYQIDQEINDAGLPVDRSLVNVALEVAEIERANLRVRLSGITGVENPNSNPQLQEWFRAMGFPMPDMQAQTLREEMQYPELPDQLRMVMELKLQLAKTSVSKWEALDNATTEGHRIRGAFQFNGAGRTGRWAGRIFQPQNLPVPTIPNPEDAIDVMMEGGHELTTLLYDQTMEVLSSTIRGAVSAPSGYKIVAADLSAIEARLAGWVCNCRAFNDTFEAGEDIYTRVASDLIGVRYDLIAKATRTYHKPVVLGGQYGLGAKGLVAYAASMGVELEMDLAVEQVSGFRNVYREIPGTWNALMEAIQSVLEEGGMAFAGKCVFKGTGEFLVCQLPSGRNIYYYQPKLEMRVAPWGDEVLSFTYMGMNQYNHQWERIATHGGKVLENIIQALGNDVLREWIRRCDLALIPLIGHVHDEVITLPVKAEAQVTLDLICSLIRDNPMPWAQDMKLDATGYISKRFRKD